MSINREKLEAMKSDHTLRVGDLQRLLTKQLEKLPVSEQESFKKVFNIAAAYYRHVGATWILEGILNGKEFPWSGESGGAD